METSEETLSDVEHKEALLSTDLLCMRRTALRERSSIAESHAHGLGLDAPA
jgi:hypothetical protein